MKLFLIILGLAIFFILSFKKTEWGILAITFLLPSYFIRFKIAFLPLTFLEGMILILTFIWLIKKIIKKDLKESLLQLIKKLKKTNFLYPILLFLLAATISVFVSPNTKEALGIWKAYFIEPFVLFLILLDVIRTKTKTNLVILALGGSAALIGIITLVQFFTGIYVPENYFEEGRMTGVYGYPTAVGLFVAPILALFLGMVIEKIINQTIKTASESKKIKNKILDASIYQKGLVKILIAIIILFSLFSIWASKTEGAYIGLAAGLFFAFMLTKWRWKIIALTILFIFVLLLVPQTRDYLITKATFKDVSGDVRLVLWQGSWRVIKANPIFGAGLAGFPNLYKKYKEARHIEISLYPHNIFLNFWTETGILGLISFLWIVVNFFRLTFKKKIFSKSLVADYQLPFFASMIYLFIHGLVDVPYFKNDLACLFWIIIGLAIIFNNLSQLEKKKTVP